MESNKIYIISLCYDNRVEILADISYAYEYGHKARTN